VLLLVNDLTNGAWPIIPASPRWTLTRPLATMAAAYTSCAKPYLVRCGVDGATSDNSSTCSFHSRTVCGAVGRPFTPATCAAKPATPEIGMRICPCIGGTDPCVVQTTAAPTVTTRTRPPITVAPPGVTAAPVPIDECERTVLCGSGCKCPAPRQCQEGLALKDGVCLAAGGCDPALPALWRRARTVSERLVVRFCEPWIDQTCM
jgi:hypothetical protein